MAIAASSAGQGESSKATADASITKGGQEERDEKSWNSSAWWSNRSDGWKDKSSSWRDYSDGWNDRSDGWNYSSWESWSWNEGKWGGQSSPEKWKNDEKPRGKAFADPEARPGWPEFKLWRRKVMRWRQTTDVETHNHADRIMKLLPIDLQRKLVDITDDDLISDSAADK
ncbi:unnamed protein product, partial [Prorocentrum cordatum]